MPVPKEAITAKAAEIDIDMSKLGQTLQPGCWLPQVSISAVPVAGPTAFAEPQVVKIDSAVSDGKTTTVKGAGFLDLKECKSPLKFQIQNGSATPQDVTGYKLVSDSDVTFDSDLSKGSSSVVAIVNDKQQASAAITKTATPAKPAPKIPATPAKK